MGAPRARTLAASIRPVVPANEQVLEVPAPLGSVLPRGGVARGATVVIDGVPGAGATSTALVLVAAATATGAWAAVVDPDGTFGACAAAEAGVVLERCVVVRQVPSERWPAVVAALCDGVALVVAPVPARLRPGDARRLLARARARGTVLVAPGAWPVEAAVRVHVRPGRWERAGSGLLVRHDLHIELEARGAVRTVAEARTDAAAGAQPLAS